LLLTATELLKPLYISGFRWHFPPLLPPFDPVK
jgi:hypothetical protein